MRMVIQKVERASVSVDGEIRGEIGNGLMVLVGILPNDDEKVMDYMLFGFYRVSLLTLAIRFYI